MNFNPEDEERLETIKVATFALQEFIAAADELHLWYPDALHSIHHALWRQLDRAGITPDNLGLESQIKRRNPKEDLVDLNIFHLPVGESKK